ncbi:YidH family protein [Pacificimonas flava]|uniref:DUF202 domain-containing protein n=1 Tax=Pacificimonas flava TaxID=1234595 RepID=M2TD88_9SPHN|nr:DUF202 domain-containing protein [Pacificimonas flava]EMD84474.1 hypothetical protein C725_0404 [Pacificimonas flava]MBB5279654.1 putative membrane protein [Pacificimonas flava]
MTASKDELAADRTDYAEKRTDWAEDRTALAIERTFSGWMRTAFAAIGIGIGFNALFDKMEPVWVPKSVATLFILIGALLTHLAAKRAGRGFDRLSAHAVDLPKLPRLRLLAWCVILGAAGLVFALWFLNGG